MHFSIAENTCFSLDNQHWRIQEHNRANASAPFIVARRKDGVVQSFPLSQFSEFYERGRLRLIQVDGSNGPVSTPIRNPEVRVSVNYSEAELNEIELRMGYVLVVADKNRQFISNTSDRREAIRQQALKIRAEKMPSDATVRRWFNCWKAKNCDPTAVLSRKGGNRTPRLPVEIEKFVEEMIDANYLNESRIRVAELADRIIRGIKAHPTLCKLQPPSQKTIYRRVNGISVFERMSLRHGREYALQHYPDGIPVRQPKYPYERFELDHTPIDLLIADEVTGEVVGKAWATFVIDAFTRMIVGFYIGLHAPSRKSVVQAIKHAILPKNYVNEMYPSIQHDLPCWGICGLLVVDNGRDLHARDAKRVMAMLNIPVQFCPPKRPNYKGKIERFLQRFNYEFIHLLPGTTFANYMKAGDYKPESVITLPVLTEMIHRWVIDDYHVESHTALGMSPLDFWNAHQHAFSAPVLLDSLDKLEELLWIELTGTIQKEGITKHNTKWNSKELQDIAKQYGMGVKIDFLLDEEDLSKVSVRIPHTKELLEVPNTMPDYAQGLSLDTHQKIRAGLKKEHGERKQYSESALMTARRKIEEIVEEAKKENKRKRRTSKGSAKSSEDVKRQAESKKFDTSSTGPKAKAKANAKPGEAFTPRDEKVSGFDDLEAV